MSITAIRGFNDILPGDTEAWRHIEQTAWSIFRTYGFSEIKFPIVEKTELFARSIGETTDIVEKEMYTFEDRHGDAITLRPEGTAPAVRAYIEHKLYTSPVTRLYYTGPMFRYERPQKGRYRQFYQIGAEVLGDDSPRADAETLSMLMKFFRALDVQGRVVAGKLPRGRFMQARLQKKALRLPQGTFFQALRELREEDRDKPLARRMGQHLGEHARVFLRGRPIHLSQFT